MRDCVARAGITASPAVSLVIQEGILLLAAESLMRIRRIRPASGDAVMEEKSPGRITAQKANPSWDLYYPGLTRMVR